MTLDEQIDPKHTALIVIDPQKDFCDPDGILAKIFRQDVSRVPGAVKRLNPLIEKARQTGVSVIWVRAFAAKDKRRPNAMALRGRGGDIVVTEEGSEGADWYSDIVKPLPTERIITKWNYDAFEDTDLDLLLSSKEISTLIFTGFATNVCVETTARHGFIKGYYIVLVSDCTGSYTQEEHDAALINIEKHFGKVATSTEIMESWEATIRVSLQ